MNVVGHLLHVSGIGRERMRVRWVSAAEGQLFATYVTEYIEQVRVLGPFDLDHFAAPLAAVETALTAPRLRWLAGMEAPFTERGNVYGDKLEETRYRRLVQDVAEEEYEKALVLNALGAGPCSVRDIALETGLPVYAVSLRLGELEKERRAHFHEYEGRTPTFMAAA
jgi:hypothetical protein